MPLLSALLLIAAVQTGPDIAQRGPADALVAGLQRVCSLYTKTGGLTPSDEAVLASEMQQRAGPTGVLRQASPDQVVRLEGYPGYCMVLVGTQDHAPLSRQDSASLSLRLTAWIDDPASGWQPAPSTNAEASSWVHADGQRMLTVLREDASDGLVAIVEDRQVAQAGLRSDDAIAARRAASARPTDQAVLDAVETVCAIASTPAWGDIQSGEVLVRHAGNSRLTVDYIQNGDCAVRAAGEDAVATATALSARLEAPGSGWTRTDHAWMESAQVGPSDSRIEANYRHQDGRELAVVLGQGEVQAILWQPLPTTRP